MNQMTRQYNRKNRKRKREKERNILGKRVDERGENSEIHQNRHAEKERTKQRNNTIMEREVEK